MRQVEVADLGGAHEAEVRVGAQVVLARRVEAAGEVGVNIKDHVAIEHGLVHRFGAAETDHANADGRARIEPVAVGDGEKDFSGLLDPLERAP